ncbi:hypothetical protein SK128_003542 [Halocaridina rubra]|uniref:Uncharacterized protein n=1 Tax=Halocaridina rubra TaxID=373956 RepID=A0AAN9ACC1_HALRR
MAGHALCSVWSSMIVQECSTKYVTYFSFHLRVSSIADSHKPVDKTKRLGYNGNQHKTEQ